MDDITTRNYGGHDYGREDLGSAALVARGTFHDVTNPRAMLDLIAAGWTVIEGDGDRITIQAPEGWDEAGETELVVDTHHAFVPLTLDDYQSRTADTAIYPGKGTAIGLAYCTSKLAGEAGEVAENFGKAIRDDGLFEIETDLQQFSRGVVSGTVSARMGNLTPERREAMKKELGDVAWYLAATAKELGFTLSEVCQANLDKLADRAARGVLQGSGDNR